MGDAVAAPKYALFERERRWLVDDVACPLDPEDRHALIEDRYIVGTRLRLRRVTDSGSDRVSFKLTKKYPADDPLARPIVTAYLTAPEYEVFARLPAHGVVKRRYVVGGFSVDRFLSPPGLPTIAEIEQSTAAALAAVRAPVWATDEISGDSRYDGAALAATSGIEPR